MALESRSQVEAQNRLGVGDEESLTTRPVALALVIVLLAAPAAAGCASTVAETAQANMQSMRDEQTPDKLVDRGRGFAAVGDPTRAEDYFSAALDAGADPRVVMPLLMEVCVQNGRYRSAIQHAENHLRQHPSDVGTRLVLGSLYAAVGDNKEAREALQHVVAQRPNEAQAHYALAVLARDTENDVRTADHHFREYLRIKPSGKHAEEARESLIQRVP